MTGRRQTWINRGAILLAFLLPIVFNPFATYPFEATKVYLLRGIILLMLLASVAPPAICGWRSSRQSKTPNEKERVPWLHKSPLALPVTGFAAINILATIVSIDRDLSLWGQGDGHGTITNVLLFMMFLILSPALNRSQHIRRLISALIAGSVPVAFYGWIQYLGLDALEWESVSASPIHSTLGRSVFLGTYLSMVVPYTLSRLVTASGRRPRQGAYAALLFLQMGCLMFTIARGAWLGLVGGLIMFGLMMTSYRPRWRWRVALLIIAGISGLGVIIFKGDLVLRNESGISAAEYLNLVRSSSNSARLAVWGRTLELIPARWILGYGPETFRMALERVSRSEPDIADTGWLNDDPHNLLLSILFSTGILGLFTFLWIGARLFSACLRSISRSASTVDRTTLIAILSSTLVYLIALQFNPDVIVTSAYFWLNLSLATAWLSNQNRLERRLENRIENDRI